MGNTGETENKALNQTQKKFMEGNKANKLFVGPVFRHACCYDVEQGTRRRRVHLVH